MTYANQGVKSSVLLEKKIYMVVAIGLVIECLPHIVRGQEFKPPKQPFPLKLSMYQIYNLVAEHYKVKNQQIIQSRSIITCQNNVKWFYIFGFHILKLNFLANKIQIFLLIEKLKGFDWIVSTLPTLAMPINTVVNIR